MKSHLHQRARKERGYILLTLMLFVALLTIGLLALVQNIESQIRRDREEELIHRGVQYSRAVRLFFVKFKRYPASVEELESTNNIRFLRKRYKDPITGKDFKQLYMNEVAVFQRVAVTAPLPAVQSQESTADSQTAEGAPEEAEVDPAIADTPPVPKSARKSDPPSSDSKGGDTSSATGPNIEDPETNGAPPLHGVPIVGVVSLSKQKTIREFDKKDHYNQWLFIFNPNGGTTGLINTPDQPPLHRSVQASSGATQDQANAAEIPNPSANSQ